MKNKKQRRLSRKIKKLQKKLVLLRQEKIEVPIQLRVVW